MSSSESDVVSIHLPMEENGERYMNTPVVFRGVEVATLDTRLFASCSMRYQRELFGTFGRNAQGPVEITSDVTQDSVLLFVAACNGERVEVQKANALDVLLLAKEWEVRELVRIMSECSDEILVAALVRCIESGKDTRNLVEQLHRRFIRIIKNEFFQKNVLKIGLAVLQQVFSMGDHDLVREHFSEVFPFMKQCVDEHFGPCACVLFSGTDALKLNPDELAWLNDSDNIDHSFMGDSYFKAIMEQRKTIDRLQGLLMEREKDLVEVNRLIIQKCIHDNECIIPTERIFTDVPRNCAKDVIEYLSYDILVIKYIHLVQQERIHDLERWLAEKDKYVHDREAKPSVGSDVSK